MVLTCVKFKTEKVEVFNCCGIVDPSSVYNFKIIILWNKSCKGVWVVAGSDQCSVYLVRFFSKSVAAGPVTNLPRASSFHVVVIRVLIPS